MIRAPQIRLLGEEGKVYGVVSLAEARRISEEEGLDLIEVSPNAEPPVVKLMDYGKYKYQAQKKLNEAKKKQAVIEVKELKFRPNIEKHDVEVKMNKVKEFLEDGDKVKLLMQFRGREIAYAETGMARFKEILAQIIELGAVVEADPKMMGNRIIALVSPSKKK